MFSIFITVPAYDNNMLGNVKNKYTKLSQVPVIFNLLSSFKISHHFKSNNL